MADWDREAFRRAVESRAAPGRGRRAGKALTWLGAATSVVLIAGLGLWSYRLAMRQIHGVPILLAPEGPARVAPENPGGDLARHQGLAVNTIAAVGEAADTADRLMLAPKAAELDVADTASDALQASQGTALAAPPEPPPVPADAGLVKPSETLAAMKPHPGQLTEPLPDGAVDPIDDPDLAAVEAGAVVAGSVEAGAAGAGAVAAGAVVAPEDLIAASVPGVVSSPRPQLRPEGDVVAEAAAMAVAAAMAPVADIDVNPAALAAGTQLAQIGSYETEAMAKLEWTKAVARFGALMEGKQRVIQAAESGGRTFFRLRVVGFTDRDDARRFCAALKSGGQCVPAQVR